MSSTNRCALPWKIIFLAAFLAAGCVEADAAERHRGGARRSLIASQPPSLTPKQEEGAEANIPDSDLWPMRGATPSAPALSAPEERMDDYYPEPVSAAINEQMVLIDVIEPIAEPVAEALELPYVSPVYEDIPSPLVYDPVPPAQSRYTPPDEPKPTEIAPAPKKGLRLRRRRNESSSEAAAGKEKAGRRDRNQLYPEIEEGETIVTSPYPPGYIPELEPGQPQWSQWDPGITPEIIYPAAVTPPVLPDLPLPYQEVGSRDNGAYYDKYHNVTPAYPQETQPEPQQPPRVQEQFEPLHLPQLGQQEATPLPEQKQENGTADIRQKQEQPVEPRSPSPVEHPPEESRKSVRPEMDQASERQSNGVQQNAGMRQEAQTGYEAPSRSRQPQPLAQPSRAEVEDYRQRLELRLLERYNNLPEHAGNVGRVEVILSKPIEQSLDGSRLRAEFDQLVYDPWGRRIPKLEEEYFVVTFAAGGAKQVRSDPSVRVGLDHETGYSERMPLNADPFAKVQQSKAFAPAPKPAAKTRKMADWWRPDFPELQ